MSESNKTVPGALEGVFAVILGQNAIIVANSISPTVFADGLSRLEFTQIGVALVTFFAVLFNWVIVRHLKYRDVSYTKANMLFDIFTAAVFGVQSQAILNSISSGQSSSSYIFLVISISFTLVSVLNVLWNRVETKKIENATPSENSELQIENIKKNDRYNYVSIALLVSLAVCTVIGYPGWAFFCFLAWLGQWAFIIWVTTTDYASDS